MSTATNQIFMLRARLTKRLSDVHGRTPGRSDERGLMMLTLTIVLMAVLSLITLTIMTGALGQLQLSSTATNRNGALEGALAGVQAVVSDIRAAANNGNVVPSELPCSNVTGQTNTSGYSSFIASIQYEYLTPSGTPSPTLVTCTTGGPVVRTSLDYTLAGAVITSCSPASVCGSNPLAAPGNNETWRRVVSTYDFSTSYSNIPGGLIDSYQGGECLEAVDNSGTYDLEVTTSCSTSNSLELFQYTSTWNLQVQIADTEYCVQDPQDGSPQSSSPVLITTNCSGAVAQWGVNDFGGLEGVETSGSPAGQPNNYCLDNPLPANAAEGTTEDVTVGSLDCDDEMDQETVWQMSPEVGAGASQPSSGEFGITDQLVNFQEFGYCLDVTGQNVNSTYLIDYMCKQFPDTSQYPVWNQRWCFDQLTTNSSNIPVGLLYTPDGQTSCSNPSSPYCLASPLEQASQDSTAYVTVTSCNLNRTLQQIEQQYADLLWTQWGNNGGYVHDYTYTDNDGYCLEANTSNKENPSGNDDYFSTIQVDTCNGAYEQKWNAPPTLAVSQITNTHEDTGPGSYSGS